MIYLQRPPSFSQIKSSIKNFRQILTPRTEKFIMFSILTSVVWMAVDMLFLVVIQIFLIALGLMEKSKAFLVDELAITPITGVVVLIGFGLFRSVLSAFKTYFFSMISEEFAASTKARIIQFALYGDHDKSSSEILLLFGNVVNYTCTFVQNIAALIVFVFSGMFYLSVGLYIAPSEFAIGLLVFAMMMAPLKAIDKFQKSIYEKINESALIVYETLLLGIKNQFLLKLYRKTKQEIDRAKVSIETYRRQLVLFHLIAGAKGALPLFAGTVVIGLITFLGFTIFETPGIRLLSIFYIFLRMAQAYSDGAVAANQLRFGFPYMKDLKKIPLAINVVEDIPSKKIEEIHSIELKDLSFSYENGIFIFKNLNISLIKGNILLIKGKSGSGKSTLISNIVGLLKPTTGQVLINGLPVDSKCFPLHEVVAHVGPDPFTIPGTVRQNLAYLSNFEFLDDQEIRKIMDESPAFQFINDLEKNLDTFLNEKTQLSTGQKQRVSFLRALLRRPQLLILDEATANLDPQTEIEVKKLIRKSSSQRITLLISHKDSFDELATQKIELEEIGHTNHKS